MLKTFKLRVFMAILIVAMASISVRTPENQEAAKKVLQFILRDYGIQQRFVEWASRWAGYPEKEAIPVINPKSVQIPCEFLSIEQSFGWKQNPKTGQQDFYPGIRFKVLDNSLVKAIMDGQIIDLGDSPQGRTILIQHGNNLYSSYVGLKEVLVEKGATITTGQTLGKSNTYLYFEIRGPSGPIDPQFILE